MSTTICRVCQAESAKYRCPTCKTSSCSLPCFKKHKTECSITSNSPHALESDSVVVTENKVEQQTPDGIDPTKLEALFKRYPTLRLQLNDVYLSTTDPAKRDSGSDQTGLGVLSNINDSTSRLAVDRYWNSEKGMKRGLEKLHSRLESQDQSSEAMHEFLNLLDQSSRAVEPTKVYDDRNHDVHRGG